MTLATRLDTCIPPPPCGSLFPSPKNCIPIMKLACVCLNMYSPKTPDFFFAIAPPHFQRSHVVFINLFFFLLPNSVCLLSHVCSAGFLRLYPCCCSCCGKAKPRNGDGRHTVHSRVHSSCFAPPASRVENFAALLHLIMMSFFQFAFPRLGKPNTDYDLMHSCLFLCVPGNWGFVGQLVALGFSQPQSPLHLQ